MSERDEIVENLDPDERPFSTTHEYEQLRLTLQKNRGRRRHKELRENLRAALGAPHQDLNAAYLSLIQESDFSASECKKASKAWRRAYYALGVPAAGLAAIAGVTALVSIAGRYIAGIMALAAAALSAIVTFLKCDEASRRSAAASAHWRALADEARLTLVRVRLVPNWEASEEAMSAFVELSNKRTALLEEDDRGPHLS